MTLATLALTVLLLVTAGCTKTPSHPVLHVTSYDSCDRPQLVGTIGNKEFALNLEMDKQTAMSVACPNPGLGLKDIGKDFPASVDLDQERVVIEIPTYSEPTVEEWQKGNVTGHQTGTKKAAFEISHMREVVGK